MILQGRVQYYQSPPARATSLRWCAILSRPLARAGHHRKRKASRRNPTACGFRAGQPQFKIADHLGNTVVLFEDKDNSGTISTIIPQDPENAEVVQRNLYYPFGMQLEGTWKHLTTPQMNYTYNNKEWENDLGLGWLFYGFRCADPAIGRFTGVDPIADQFASLSPFNYASNNPVLNIDLHGLQGLAFYRLSLQIQKKFSDFNATRTGLNNAMKMVQDGQEPTFTQKAGNTVTAFTMHFGNFTSQNDVAVLQSGENFDGTPASGFDKALAGVFVFLPISGNAVKNLTGEGVELLGKFVNKFTNQASHLDSKHINAAVGDILGNPITIGGKTYDHLDEVQNALSGLGKELGNLNDAIDAGSFSGEVLDAAKNLRSTLQKQKDEITDVLNRAKEKAGD